MPERFEIYIVYKRRYINTLPFLSFPLQTDIAAARYQHNTMRHLHVVQREYAEDVCLCELDPGIDEKDPRWIGAWWLGFVVCAACLFIWALPVSMFPSQLTGYDVSKDTQEMTTRQDKELLSNLKG